MLFTKKIMKLKILYINYMELYLFILYKLNSNKKDILNIYSDYFSKKINDINKFNLDYESLFIEFKSKVIKWIKIFILQHLFIIHLQNHIWDMLILV